MSNHISGNGVHEEDFLIHYPFETPVGANFTIYCVIKAPRNLDASSLSCEPVDQSEVNFIYKDNEEITSPIFRLISSRQGFTLPGETKICIPFYASRATAAARDPLIKLYDGTNWKDLYTKEITMDEYKDYRFAQAEVRDFGVFAAVTRFKHNSMVVHPGRFCSLTSSADHRVVVTFPEDAFTKPQQFSLEINPVDSASLQDLKGRNNNLKNLLTTSPVVHLNWQDGGQLKESFTVTVPCPPNPAKAKKLAEQRAQKEAKLRAQQRTDDNSMQDARAERAKKRSQAVSEHVEGETVKRKEIRWYMGQYGATDDDETDKLFLLQGYSTGRWSLHRDITINQLKVDLLQLEINVPMEKFIVLRTRVQVDDNTEDELVTMASSIVDYLSKRLVNVIVRQRKEDPFDAVVLVTLSKNTEKVVQALESEGYTDGPVVGSEVMVKEGDLIDIQFRGNVAACEVNESPLIYNSQLITRKPIRLMENNPYLQKDFASFHGLIQISRKYAVSPHKSQKQEQKVKSRKTSFVSAPIAVVSEEDDRPSEIKYQTELLFQGHLNLPKDHIPPVTPPTRVMIIIKSSDDINDTNIRHVAEELGEEWQQLASFLKIPRFRVQSMLRNALLDNSGVEIAKYNMLVSWWKSVPYAMNKANILARSLDKCGRQDLANELRLKERITDNFSGKEK